MNDPMVLLRAVHGTWEGWRCMTRAGLIGLEYSAFSVDGRPDLGVVIYTPATPRDTDRIRSLIRAQKRAPRINRPQRCRT